MHVIVFSIRGRSITATEIVRTLRRIVTIADEPFMFDAIKSNLAKE